MKIFWTKEAILRLQEIQNYISRDNTAAAIEFVNELISVAETISDYPEKGRIVPELSIEKIREVLHKNYRVVYLIKKNSIDILTLFEGHQLLKKEEIFKNRKMRPEQ
jgi:addiction module RelE/StbE family toxin